MTTGHLGAYRDVVVFIFVSLGTQYPCEVTRPEDRIGLHLLRRLEEVDFVVLTERMLLVLPASCGGHREREREREREEGVKQSVLFFTLYLNLLWFIP